jgi:glycine hydroxymethyltransferase
MSLSKTLQDLLTQEAQWREQTINLNASENYTSALVKKTLSHPSYDFYAFPPSGGTIKGPWDFSEPYLWQIEQHINQLGKELLECEIIDARPKGGQAAEVSVLLALAKTGDTVFYVEEKDGGHFGLNYMSEKMGIQLMPLCFDPDSFLLDTQKSLALMKTVWKETSSPHLIMIGQSFILRKQTLDEFSYEIKKIFPHVFIAYDVSHTLGLMIGKQFPNPLSQGIDLIHGSTHKTFPGPQKAIIGFPNNFNLDLRDKIQKAISPGLQSNCGTSEILALAVALEEMKIHGEEYAKKVCINAKYFANLLDTLGFNVIGKHFDFTETHQIWIAMGDEQQAWQAFSDLHVGGIRVYPAFLPCVKTWGLRLSTNAITRLGFTENEINLLSEWIKKILLEKMSPKIIKQQVKNLMANFSIKQVKYAEVLY